MKILIDKEILDYENKMFINGDKISFAHGEEYIPSENCAYIVPGFIDRHIHGGYGYDFMDKEFTNIENLLTLLPSEGTTSVLATTTTMSRNRIVYAMNNVEKLKTTGTKVQGIHLEGPFLNPLKVGAQNPKYLIPAEKELLLNNLEKIKMISYAPELTTIEFTKYLIENKIKASCVHSNATQQELEKHTKVGLNSISHFYNGSSVFSHRDPGVVNAGLANQNIEVELICDGIHINPDVINFTTREKDWNKIILVTDSVRAKGLEDGEYELGGQQVFKAGNEVRLKSGSLAGSVLPMNVAVKNFSNYTKDTPRAFYSASSSVALSLGLTNVGFIKEGYKFDIVELDEDFNVLKTYIDGQVKYIR